MSQRNVREQRMLSRTARGGLMAAYALYGATVAFLVLSPSAVTPSAAVVRVVSVLEHAGVTVSASAVEFGLNIVMLAPLSFLGGLLLPKLRIADWVLIGFGLSLLIETVQRLLLPRSGTSRDIVANTLGSLLGAVALAVVLALLSARAERQAGNSDEGR